MNGLRTNQGAVNVSGPLRVAGMALPLSHDPRVAPAIVEAMESEVEEV